MDEDEAKLDEKPQKAEGALALPTILWRTKHLASIPTGYIWFSTKSSALLTFRVGVLLSLCFSLCYSGLV